MTQPKTIIRDSKGQFASRRKRKVKVWIGDKPAGPRFSREIIKKWRARETGPVIPPEVTLRQRIEHWAGIKARARKREIPAVVEFAQEYHEVARVRFENDDTFGDMLVRSRMLRLVAAYRPGQKLRIRIEGVAEDGQKIERGNEFVLRGNAGKRMNILLYQTIAVFGKEFLTERGRGYRILTKNDKITFILEVVARDDI